MERASSAVMEGLLEGAAGESVARYRFDGGGTGASGDASGPAAEAAAEAEAEAEAEAAGPAGGCRPL